MRTLIAAAAASLLLASTAAQAAGDRPHARETSAGQVRKASPGQRRAEPRTRDDRRESLRRDPAERRVVHAYREEPADDAPYGPIYQTQEQELHSMYDVAAGRRGNIKEYWWRY